MTQSSEPAMNGKPVSLRSGQQFMLPAKRITRSQTIAFLIFATMVIRMVMIGVRSIIDLAIDNDAIMGVLRSIDNLNYLIAFPLAVVAYFYLTSGEQTGIGFDTFKAMFRNRSAVLGTILIFFMLLVADFASIIATHDPLLSMIGQPGETGRLPTRAPCIAVFGCSEPQHFMGLDLNARDMFSRIVYGAQTSLTVGISSVTFAIVIGSFLGMVAGYVGGLMDNFIMLFMDVLLAFPSLLLAISIVTIRGPGLDNALLAIAIVSIPIYARLSRASVLSVKELEFVTAERSLGAAGGRILFQQIMPNSLTPIIVQGALGIGGGCWKPPRSPSSA